MEVGEDCPVSSTGLSVCARTSGRTGFETVADEARLETRTILSGVGTAVSRCDLVERRWKGGQILGAGVVVVVVDDTRSLYKPRSHMPKFGRVWKTHQSLDKRNG